jgi:hypothetical protein
LLAEGKEDIRGEAALQYNNGKMTDAKLNGA